MSAPVTEAHHQLALAINGDDSEFAWLDAQLIADSEAKATAELRTVFPQICAALGNGAFCTPDVSVEFIKAIPNEVAEVVAQLRAEVERLTAGWDKYSNMQIEMDALFVRAERAEADADSTRERARSVANSLDEAQAELAAERARLDYMSNCVFEHLHNETGDHLGYEWTISSDGGSCDVTLRDVIDAEMKEEAK